MTWLRCLVAAVISKTEVCRQIDEAGHTIHYYNISRRLEIGISIVEGFNSCRRQGFSSNWKKAEVRMEVW